MQAIALFAMFGLLASVIGGIIGSSTESIAAFNVRLEAEQGQQFERVRTVMLGQIVRDRLESPGSGSQSDPSLYLCGFQSIRMLADCQPLGGQPTMVDVWHRPVLGRVQRNNGEDIYHTTRTNIFTARVPVTGYALVSMGPDGRLDARLQADLNNLNAGSTPDDVLKLQPYRTASGTPANDSLDDIVYVFSDKEVQQATLAELNASVGRIAASAERLYQHRFNSFQNNLPTIYKNTFDGTNANVTISDAELSRWQASVTAKNVKFTGVTKNDLSALGVKQDQDFIERVVPLNYQQAFTLNVANPTDQRVDFSLATANGGNGTNWRFVRSPSCIPVDISTCTGTCRRRLSINCTSVQGGAT